VIDFDTSVHGVDADGENGEGKIFRQQNQETLARCPEDQRAFADRKKKNDVVDCARNVFLD
jgi:hypothetical protein